MASQNRLPKKPKGDVPDATSILFAVYGDGTRQTRTKKPKCETSRAHEEGSFPGLRHGLEVPRLGLKHPRVSLELTVSETQNRVSEGLAGGLTEWLPGRVALSMQVDGRGGRRVTRRSMFHATPQGRHLSSLVASTGPSWHWDTVDWGWGGGGGWYLGVSLGTLSFFHRVWAYKGCSCSRGVVRMYSCKPKSR